MSLVHLHFISIENYGIHKKNIYISALKQTVSQISEKLNLTNSVTVEPVIKIRSSLVISEGWLVYGRDRFISEL
jgi:hypothetical protein